MILAFGKPAPADSSQPKKFGLLSLVVSVAVALGLVGLGPGITAVPWSGFNSRQGNSVTSLNPSGATQDHRDLSSTVDLSPRSRLGSTRNELEGLRVRRLKPNVQWDNDLCTCTGSANGGGLGWIEFHFTDISANPGEPDLLGNIETNLKVEANGGGGWGGGADTLLYPDGLGDGDWAADDAGHELFNFTFPTDGKKVTQTLFYICLGDDYDNLPCDPKKPDPVNPDQLIDSTESTCTFDATTGCYMYDLHTSCSVSLIGETLLIGEENDRQVQVAVVEWADRSTPQNICRPCGNGKIDGAEQCENFSEDNLGPDFLPDGCTDQCICDSTNATGTGLWEPDGNGGCRLQNLCGNGVLDDGEECDASINGQFGCPDDGTCTCERPKYPDDSGGCEEKSCAANHEVCDNLDGDPCICGACVESARACHLETEDCCGGTCIAKSDDTGKYTMMHCMFLGQPCQLP